MRTRKIDMGKGQPQPRQRAGDMAAEELHQPDDARIAPPFAGEDLNDNQFSPGAQRLGYFGVILRAVERGSVCRYEIVIGHCEEGRSKLFAAYDDDEYVVADWRSLGAELQLPLYILTAEGKLECATIAPAPNMRQRRFGSPLSGRRPRFLARRRPGQPSLMGIVHPVLTICG